MTLGLPPLEHNVWTFDLGRTSNPDGDQTRPGPFRISSTTHDRQSEGSRFYRRTATPGFGGPRIPTRHKAAS